MEKKRYAILYQEKELVFPDETRGYLSHRKILSNFHKIEKEAGLNGFTFHSLRHTFCSMWINKNPKLNSEIIKKMVRSSGITITMDIYGHLFKDTYDKIIDECSPFDEAIIIESE